MSKVDYSKINEITIENQEELDLIPLDFRGRIYIRFGTRFDPAIVKNNYYYRVVARGNSSVVARGNSSVVARENSSVVARENSSVVASENSSVVAWENSSVEAWENSSVVARENSSVVAWENSSVEAWENSSVVAMENSSVVAWENSSVVARENSSVVASSNVQIVDCLQGAKIKISGNARIVYTPKTIDDFMNFYGIKHNKKSATFYKAVHKNEDKLFSDYDDNFQYQIGKTLTETCDSDTDKDCSFGINISHLQWALDFGSSWDDLTILECSTAITDIILPKYSNGKVRTCKCKIIREVPLSECGLYGKILSKRNTK